MSRTRPFRRGRLIVELSMAAAVVALSCAAAPPDAGSPDVSHLGRFTITKTDPPADVLAQGRTENQAAEATQAVLEKSPIREIQAYRDFLRKSARLDKAGQLEAVNDYVAAHVRATADDNLYKANDVWAPPINTLMIGGDCEDLALLKYWGLKYLGFSAKDMFLVVGVTTNVSPPEGHAVLVARLSEGNFVVLDNTDRRVLPLEDAKSFQPAYAINTFGFWRVDDPSYSYGDFWRQTFKASADRHAR